jgi:hypothetical protein
LIAGTGKHLAGTTQVMLVGGSYTPAEVTMKLQRIVTLRSDVDAARAAAKTKLAAEKADMPAMTRARRFGVPAGSPSVVRAAA